MPTKQAIPHLDFEKYTLANGLDVILSEDHRLPLVAVSVWYHVGPVNERPGLTGFAHLFEHMMFEGSRHVGEEGHIRRLEAAGASEINGTTDFDRTNYFETLPSNQLELALWLESDRMGFLLEKLDAQKLENQRDVVRNERRQSVEGQPYGLVQEELFHRLFPEGHPYYASVMGSHADIEAARLEDVREFFRLYYAPNNASLAIVGDIDRSRTKGLVEKYFGPIPCGPSIPRIEVITPPIESERRVVVTDRVELPRIYIAWITDPIYTQEDAEFDLIARIVGGGKSSRLYKNLVYKKRIAQDAVAHQYSLSLGSIFMIEATAKPGISPEDLEIAVDQELEAFRKRGPSQAELRRSRNIMESAIIRGLENLGGFGGIADRLNQYNHFLGDPGFLEYDLARYRKATPSSLQALAQGRLLPGKRVVVYGITGEKVVADVPRSPHAAGPDVQPPSAPADAGQDWRRTVPEPGPASSLRLPVPESFRLANGLVVLLLEQHKLPVVSASLVVLSGSDQNPPHVPGLASFTADMLDEGTGKRSALRIAADADQLGASLSSGANMDASVIAFRSLKRNAASVFRLAADVLLDPVFPEKEVERLRHDRLTHLIQQKDVPYSLAARFFASELYGRDHPYGYGELGTETSNRAITQALLQDFWRSGYAPTAAALIVAGDVSRNELEQLAENHFGSWCGTRTPVPPPPVTPNRKRRILVIDKPGSPQTSLRLGHLGIDRAHSDYVPLTVMNALLGGLFSSRINMNLREKHGYTYGATSAFACRRGPGPFVIGTSVRTDVTAPAVSEILLEIERMRSVSVMPEELATARSSISRSLPGLFETTPQAAATLARLFVHNLALDYYRALPADIQRVTAAEVLRVAAKYLRPEEAILVAVGDRSRILDPLAKLEFGPIRCLDVEGNPMDP